MPHSHYTGFITYRITSYIRQAFHPHYTGWIRYVQYRFCGVKSFRSESGMYRITFDIGSFLTLCECMNPIHRRSGSSLWAAVSFVFERQSIFKQWQLPWKVPLNKRLSGVNEAERCSVNDVKFWYRVRSRMWYKMNPI